MPQRLAAILLSFFCAALAGNAQAADALAPGSFSFGQHFGAIKWQGAGFYDAAGAISSLWIDVTFAADSAKRTYRTVDFKAEAQRLRLIWPLVLSPAGDALLVGDRSGHVFRVSPALPAVANGSDLQDCLLFKADVDESSLELTPDKEWQDYNYRKVTGGLQNIATIAPDNILLLFRSTISCHNRIDGKLIWRREWSEVAMHEPYTIVEQPVDNQAYIGTPHGFDDALIVRGPDVYLNTRSNVVVLDGQTGEVEKSFAFTLVPTLVVPATDPGAVVAFDVGDINHPDTGCYVLEAAAEEQAIFVISSLDDMLEFLPQIEEASRPLVLRWWCDRLLSHAGITYTPIATAKS